MKKMEGFHGERGLKKSTTFVDTEFRNVEGDFSLKEGLFLSMDFFDEVWSQDKKMTGEGGRDTVFYSGGLEEGLKHFYLPVLPYRATIKEGVDLQTSFISSSEHVFVRVCQNEMWTIQKDKGPYLKFGMTSCSAIVGVDEKDITVAHVGLSEGHIVEATVQHLLDKGVPLDNIFVVASVGQSQEKAQKYSPHQKIATSVDFYTDMGISKDHVYPFEYSFVGPIVREDGKEVVRFKDAVSVIISSKGVGVHVHDLDEIGGFLTGTEEQGEEKDFHVMSFS